MNTRNILKKLNKTQSFAILILLIIFFLCLNLNSKITGSEIKDDARQNLRAAYNICKWGIFSTKSGTLKKPPFDNYREPLYPFTASILLCYYKKNAENLTARDFIKGKYSRLIKKVNLLWSFLVLLGSAFLSFILTKNRLFSLLAVLLVYLCFLRNPQYIDRFYSEIPTAALMLWASLLLILSFREQKPGLFLLTGLFVGLLSLTKAIFLYTSFPVLIVIMFYLLSGLSKASLKIKSACILFFVLGISVTVGPWVLRNKAHFDSFDISRRGGAVLYGRALKNQMDRFEIIAAFYLWGPGAYRRLVKNSFLDVKQSEYEEGGKAARLNRSGEAEFAPKDFKAQQEGKPEDAISFHSKSRATRVKTLKEFKDSDHPNPEQATDNYLNKKARQMIVANPIRHTIMTIPFAWRGSWCFYGGGFFTILNAFCYLSFIAVLLYGLLEQHLDIIAFVTIPFFMLLFHAFFTHNLNRYNSPVIPFMIISLFIVFKFFIEHHNKKSDIGSNN